MKTAIITRADLVDAIEEVGGRLVASITITEGAGFARLRVRTPWFTLGMFDAILRQLLNNAIRPRLAMGTDIIIDATWRKGSK